MSRSGFRLTRLEVFNWGTFGGAVWGLDAGGDNTLLTGDIGSGKSTLVDAITTLLVPPQKLAYNRAAGADARERTLRSYVLGYYKSERGQDGGAARAVPLRDKDTYAVILGRFENEAFRQVVTLAQVFWLKDTDGQPDRFYVVADQALAIAEDFASFGSEIGNLRKRLKRAGHEVEESFVRYATSFRRRFGIENEQALDLFHQTVSMKSVGNLTDFVRHHMLQPFPVDDRITALVAHFNDLNRAHEAVLKAKAQVDALTPLVADCAKHAIVAAEIEALRRCRSALGPWFSGKKSELLERRLENLAIDLARVTDQIASLEEERARASGTRDDIKRAIIENGGDRIEGIRAEIQRSRGDLAERQARAQRYETLAARLGLPVARDVGAFTESRAMLNAEITRVEDERAKARNAFVEAEVEFQKLREMHQGLQDELVSLRQRRSNVPAQMLAIREMLCQSIGLDEEELPFAGELLRVQDAESAWEGAIERALHGFGISLLVPEVHYAEVSHWVNKTHLRARLVYLRVRPVRTSEPSRLHPRSLVHKLHVKPESDFWGWLEAELARRFDYACCDTLEDFRREPFAITTTGQIKTGNERHEKDDRHRIDDRSRYVLGWTNEAKIAVLEKQARDLEVRIQAIAERISKSQDTEKSLDTRLRELGELGAIDSFRTIDWRPIATQIDTLEAELARLESDSDILATLATQLRDVETLIERLGRALTDANGARGAVESKQEAATRLKAECDAVVTAASEEVRAALGEAESLIVESLGSHQLTVESCDNREKDVRQRIQERIDAEEHRSKRLAEKIVQAMEAYRNAYPLDTREADASIAAAAEYQGMLERLRTDDLPRFESRFKQLLNENTIREVASFQAQLHRERQDIKERIDVINRSLIDIDYNPGRFIALEPDPTTDAEIREFQQDLRACTEGALTGSDDDAYSEAKFLQVKRIIERFCGREGLAEVDTRWTRKVTDVRHWFTFSASEKWREDGREHEHYTDSGGKSGGQKEKLAYTVLAASLAYQFGLEWGAERSRSFHFVVIDEAFGRGSDESTRYGLSLFERLNLQLLVVTPLQKIHVIEPHVASVGFVHNEEGRKSMIRNLTIEEYRAEQAAARSA